MLPRLLEQVAVLAAVAAMLGVPGLALISLLRIRAALPDSLAVPLGALLGVLVGCIATAVELSGSWPWGVGFGVHCGLSALLVVAALVVRRRRAAKDATFVPVQRGWGLTTTGLLVVGAAFAWVVRGAVRLDTLYHVSVSRKLVDLAHPNFDNVNRFADGGPNPAYALPGWHAMLGWAAQITHTDPILVWEILPVLIVALGALAAGGLAMTLLRSSAALPLGAGAWILMRELYARREVDGDAIAFGAVPGQLVFELALPVLFGAVAIALWDTADRRSRRPTLVAAVTCVIALVVLHANYVLYVGIVGAGATAWWFVAGPRDREITRRTFAVWGVVAAACVVCVGVLLPLLAQLQNFGNAPEDARIDYHLAHLHGMTLIRGGHVYEMFTMPGLVALLVAPVVAWRWRSPGIMIASGGLLAVGAFSFVPPLYSLLAATGSLTVGLRINHLAGVLLGPMLVGGVLLAAEAVRAWRPRSLVLLGAPVTVALMVVGVVLGYTRFLPDWPGYLAIAALLVVFVATAVRARRERRAEPPHIATHRGEERAEVRSSSRRIPVLAVCVVLVVGLGFPVGFVSIRRAVNDSSPLTTKPTAAGDLECLGGFVADELGDLPPGSVVLSDPRTSFLAMAEAPVYVVGDYKVWNAATKNNRTTERLAQVNRFFDTSADPADRLKVLTKQHVDYLLVDMRDPRWLTEDTDQTGALGSAMRALDSFADVQSYDGRGVAALVDGAPAVFGTPTLDPAGRDNAIPPKRPDDHVSCNAFALWRIDATAAERAAERTSHLQGRASSSFTLSATAVR